MKRLWLYGLCVCLVLCMLPCLVACGDEPSTTPSDADDDGIVTGVYVPDEAINAFILDVKDYSAYAIQSIQAGDTQGSYILEINFCEVTVYRSDYGLGISIPGGPDEKAQTRLLQVFELIARAADSSCTDEQIDAALAYMQLQQAGTTDGYRVSNYVQLAFYTPALQMETLQVDSQIQLYLLNYLPPK